MASANVTRRKLLRRAGAGAAAVGAGAMVSAASAQAAQSPTECFHAGGCVDCPAADFPCHGDRCCYCFMSASGCCFCAEDFFCDSTHACHTDVNCPPGWGCVYSCCGEGTVCAPPCGTVVPGVNYCEPTHHGVQATGRASGSGKGASATSHHPEPESPPPHRGHGHQ
jgi:hypothetical protein